MFQINKLLQILFIALLFSFSLAATAESTNDLFRQKNDPVGGNPNGKITIVEFFDYQCGHCVTMAPVISAIIKANPDVRVVYKELPIRGNMSQFASRAALAANKQGKYDSFSHALLTTDQPLTETSVLGIAKKVGLNVSQLKKDMADRSIYTQLNENMDLAQTLKLSGTPAFFIGKTNVSDSNDIDFRLGQMSQTELQDAINKIK